MTATLPDVAANKKEQAEQSAEQQVAAELGFFRCHGVVTRGSNGGERAGMSASQITNARGASASTRTTLNRYEQTCNRAVPGSSPGVGSWYCRPVASGLAAQAEGSHEAPTGLPRQQRRRHFPRRMLRLRVPVFA